MKEVYVSYEVAKLLKEKGFDWECRAYWHEDDRELIESQSPCHLRNITNPCWFGNTAPTQQMACRWLREEHKIFIEVGVGTDIDGVFGYMPSIYFLDILACNEGRFSPNVDADYICDFTPQTYEYAVEAALKYVLTNLI